MNDPQISEIEERLKQAQKKAKPSGGGRWFRFRTWWRVRADPAAKRALDVLVAGLAMLLLSPFAVILALALKLQDGGPVLYWQKRVGLHGVLFDFPKFRSMRTDSDVVRRQLEKQNEHGSNEITFKLENDPRITRIGRFIRRTSIDELPQLWSVFKGQMSLVGPRPALPQEVARYTLYERRRLEAVPGLTCIWQISGRSQIPFTQQVELDVLYIETRSIFLDIEILLKTVPAVLFARGAS
jgi:lipopolysaccharide/colanic/teichoic acid biosynthesis glycosyltransferase